MSEDRTAQAALAIERYIGGLRSELSLLGAAEATDLLDDVRSMLLDAAREDPERAFTEMSRLGEPSELAAALLTERGVAPDGGVPVASWWRLGTAAVIDIFVALALPVAVVVGLYQTIWRSAFAGPGAEPTLGYRIGILAASAAVVALAAWLGWRTTAPWRNGGRSATPGMALAKIAVLKVGGTRSAVRNNDLVAAGIPVPSRTGLSAWAAVVLALLALAWSVAMVSAGALDPSGAGAVAHLAGTTHAQEASVVSAANRLYEAAFNQAALIEWPPMEEDRVSPGALRAELIKRFGAEPGSAGSTYEIGTASNTAPGIWTVSVSERPAHAAARQALLTYSLRLDWNTGDQPTATWLLTGYAPGK
jgi:hypothetical protein